MADTEQLEGSGAHPKGSDSLLLLARPADEGAAAYCRDHLVPGGTPDSAPIVVLTEGSSGAATLPRDHDGKPGVVVAVGHSRRSSAEVVGDPPPSSLPETVIETGDLGSVGRTVDDYLTSWSSSGYRLVVCVGSLSGLVEHGSIQGTYRFLYVLLHRVEEEGGALHVHADPRAHEEEILRTFFSLFDRVVSFQQGGAPHR